MMSLAQLGTQPAGLPLAADDIVEFHAARLLLLLHVCGTAGRIDGLTKLAKLDFFVRYPRFFEVAKATAQQQPEPTATADAVVESAMVRHHYGPWDKRYYQVLAVLEGKDLINVAKSGRSYQLALTDEGKRRAKALAVRPSFETLVARMRDVKKVFGSKAGSALKELIYRLFEEEVARRPMGKVIGR
jgi:hypothetical protein